LHLLPLALVLVSILPLPLLVPGAILGIMPRVATSETFVVIGLAVLLLLIIPLCWKLVAVGCLLLLLIIPLCWKLVAVGCLLLLLLLRSNYPSPLLLLGGEPDFGDL
jgi:hypothetical protein